MAEVDDEDPAPDPDPEPDLDDDEVDEPVMDIAWAMAAIAW